MYWCCLQVFSPRQYDELLSKIASFNSLFAIIVGVFNARFSSWRNKDNTTHLEALTSLHNIDQFISEPLHILSLSSSCIDLVFTNPPNSS